MKEQLTGWLTRDGDLYGTLKIFERKPRREFLSWEHGYFRAELPRSLFPNITWKDEPVKVSITIETKDS